MVEIFFKKLILRYFNCICYGREAEIQSTIACNFFGICFKNLARELLMIGDDMETHTIYDNYGMI